MNWVSQVRAGKECARPGACNKMKSVLYACSVACDERMVREEAPQASRSQVMKGLKPLCRVWNLSRRIFHNKVHIPLNGIVNVTSKKPSLTPYVGPLSCSCLCSFVPI